MPDKLKRYIGIDFGTSSSVVSYYDYKFINNKWEAYNMQHPQMIQDRGSSIIPTLIVEKDTSLGIPDDVFGNEAKELAMILEGAKLHCNFKMDIFNDKDKEKQEKAVELTNKFFAFLQKRYKEYENLSEHAKQEYEFTTMVSYPVRSIYKDQDYVVNAAKAAGFLNVTRMNEPQAALRFFLSNKTKTEPVFKEYSLGHKMNILMIDMGAGTTDIILYQYTCSEAIEKEKLEEKASWPKLGETNTFGGYIVDKRLLQYLKTNSFIDDTHINSSHMEPLLIQHCKEWKEHTVSRTLNSPATSSVRTLGQLAHYSMNAKNSYVQMQDFHINRECLEHICKDYLPIFTGALKDVVKSAKINESDIDVIITVGGHSQWYFVRDLIMGKKFTWMQDSEKLNFTKIIKEPARLFTPDKPHEIVSMGLAKNEEKFDWKPISKHEIWIRLSLFPQSIDEYKKRDDAYCESNKIELKGVSKDICILKEEDVLPIPVSTQERKTIRDKMAIKMLSSQQLAYKAYVYTYENNDTKVLYESSGWSRRNILTTFYNWKEGTKVLDVGIAYAISYRFDESEDLKMTFSVQAPTHWARTLELLKRE